MRSLAKLVTGTQKTVLNNCKRVRTGGGRSEVEVEEKRREEERKKQYVC